MSAELVLWFGKVILCIKEVNEKARGLAMKRVTALGHSAQQCFAAGSQEGISV